MDALQTLFLHYYIHCRWQNRIAKQAVELVGKEEEEDLYFEGGHHSQEFVKLVVSPPSITKSPLASMLSMSGKSVHK